MKRLKHDVVGRKYGKDNQLTVIGISDKIMHGHKLYMVRCSVCCLDSELFGDGIFLTPQSRIVANTIPCGCSSSQIYSEDQAMVLINRNLSKKNYSFLGFIGEYAGLKKTMIKVKCNKDGNVWDVCISNILKNEEGCNECWKKHLGARRKISDADNISLFFDTGKFHKNTVFSNSNKQNKEGRDIWKYKCGKCSNDEYVLNGFCSGVFIGVSMQLRIGHLSCRCTQKYRWTLEQREYQAKKAIKERGLDVSFIGFEGYKTKKFKVKLLCHKHGEYSALFNDFINKKTQCMSCANSGYNSKNDAIFYIIKTESFIGYGITGKIKDRINTHRRYIKDAGLNILSVDKFSGTGVDVLNIENEVKNSFPCNKQDITGFVREATFLSYYDELISMVKNNTLLSPVHK